MEITRHGQAVATVVPQRDYEKLQEKGQGLWEALGKIQEQGIVIEDRELSNLRDTTVGRSVDLD